MHPSKRSIGVISLFVLAVLIRIVLALILRDDKVNFPSRMEFIGYFVEGRNPYEAIHDHPLDSYGIPKWPYPPLAIVPLIPAAIAFKTHQSEDMVWMLYKLPSILADFVAAGAMWLLARDHLSKSQSYLLLFLFFFNPL